MRCPICGVGETGVICLLLVYLISNKVITMLFCNLVDGEAGTIKIGCGGVG